MWSGGQDLNLRPTAPKAKYLSYTMPLIIKLKADKNGNGNFNALPLSYTADLSGNSSGNRTRIFRLTVEVTVSCNSAFMVGKVGFEPTRIIASYSEKTVPCVYLGRLAVLFATYPKCKTDKNHNSILFRCSAN